MPENNETGSKRKKLQCEHSLVLEITCLKSRFPTRWFP